MKVHTSGDSQWFEDIFKNCINQLYFFSAISLADTEARKRSLYLTFFNPHLTLFCLHYFITNLCLVCFPEIQMDQSSLHVKSLYLVISRVPVNEKE